MKRKKLTKIFMMISNEKNPLSLWFIQTNFSIVMVNVSTVLSGKLLRGIFYNIIQHNPPPTDHAEGGKMLPISLHILVII